MLKTAIVIGASGATGKELVKSLLKDDRFEKVKIFVRKKLTDIDITETEKLIQFEVDFDAIENWKENITGDVLFSALGTTIKIAKTKKNQYKIDYHYQYNVAKFASENGVPNYVLVSSYGASPKSSIFYSKMKGELEEAIKKLNFAQISIFQPGILDRHQKDDRSMEQLSLKIIRFLNKFGILKKQRPMPVETLADKMIKVALTERSGVNYYRLDVIFEV